MNIRNNSSLYPLPETEPFIPEGQQQITNPGISSDQTHPISHLPIPNNIHIVNTQPNIGYGNMPTIMTMAPGIPNCPSGLEYLTTVDQLLVQQQLEILEILTGFETKNKYLITNNLGQKVYFAAEESDCLSRNFLGNIRPFNMKIMDNFGNQVISLYRPLACQSCCYPCCLQKLEVYAPLGCLIGTVEQLWSICTPTYSVKDVAGDVVFRIEGNCCACRCCADVNFKVMLAANNSEVGRITKKWGGLLKETYSDADNFGITFPIDLDVRMKATLLGALFLIDYMYFETSNNNNI